MSSSLHIWLFDLLHSFSLFSDYSTDLIGRPNQPLFPERSDALSPMYVPDDLP